MARRLLLLLMLPLLLSGGFAVALLLDVYETPRRTVQAGIGADVALALGGLVDALNTEAIVSAMYTVDDLEAASDAGETIYRGLSLVEAQNQTDQLLELSWDRFRSSGGSFPGYVKTSIGESLATVEVVTRNRELIETRQLTQIEIAERYDYAASLVLAGMFAQENASDLRDLVGEVAAFTSMVAARNELTTEYLGFRALLAGDAQASAVASDLQASAARQDESIRRAQAIQSPVEAITAVAPSVALLDARKDIAALGVASELRVDDWDAIAEDWRQELDVGVGAARRWVQFRINEGQAIAWATFRRTVAVAVAVFMLGSIVTGFLGWLVHQRVRTTRDKMVQVASSEGDAADVANGLRGRDEVYDIAAAFDQLSARVSREQALQRSGNVLHDRVAKGVDVELLLRDVEELASAQLQIPVQFVRENPEQQPIRPATSYPVFGHRADEPVGWLVSDHNTAEADLPHRDRVLASCASIASLMIEVDLGKQERTYSSTHDELTGLSNLNALMAEVDRVLGNDDVTQICVLRMAIGGLKDINDKYDRSVGDEVLIEAGNRLRQAVGSGGMIARVGGGEFVIKAAGMPSEASAVELAQLIIDGIEEPFQVGSGKVSLTATVGLALSEPGMDAATLVRNAELAHYRANASGPGRFEVYEDSLGEWASEQIETGQALELALTEDQIEVWFQPIFGTGGGLAGFEGLVRWNRPDHGIVSPAVFLPIAEESGLIVDLGRQVLEKGCKQLAEWAGRDSDAAAFLSLNVSATEMTDPDYVRHVASVLESTGAPADRLVLEVTETTLVSRKAELIPTMRQLEQLGVHIAIDNFGSGHSSLAYLRELPIDMLKIDRTFTAEAAHSEEVAAIISTIVGLADALGMTVVAEGVEDPDQLRSLKALGVQLSQGYLLGRPMTAFAATRIWDEQAA